MSEILVETILVSLISVFVGKKKIVLQMTIYKFLKTIFEDSITE